MHHISSIKGTQSVRQVRSHAERGNEGKGRFARAAALALIALLLAASPALAQRDLKDIPDPDSELERKTFTLPEGFEVNLFAADPKMAKPIHMNFDAQGRLWIASSEVYPQVKPGQEPTDKILVLEDADGDGKAEKTSVFADGLLIPTGVVPGDGGAYVVNSTELLHLSDTDGDGKADKRRIALSGFGTEDTHHLLHSLRWGHDGALYMNQSIYIHSHVETPYGVKHLNGGGIWRYRTDTQELDVLCRGFVNPWGHHQDHWGQHFATDGAYGEGINYVFPGSVFVTAPGEKRFVQGLNPGSPKHCGLEIVGGRHLPDDWQGSMITCDFRAHRVCRFVVSEDGSGFASRQEVEVIKSTHPAFRPIDVKMGPDGAIYIADWYNPIIQHGEVDFRDPRRDHVHGRIWRVTAKGRALVPKQKIVGAPIGELLELLKSPEEWVRLWAKQELKTRERAELAAALTQWLKRLDKDHPDYEHHRLEALWAAQTAKQGDFVLSDPLDSFIEGLLLALMKSPDHRVRAANTRASGTRHTAIAGAAARDEHPRVRLEGVRALARTPSVISAEIAATALDKPMDRWLDFALWQTMRDLSPQWLPALQKGEIDFSGNVDHLTFALKAVDSPAVVAPLMKLVQDKQLSAERRTSILTLIATLGGPNELGQVLTFVLADKSLETAADRAALLNALVDATVQRRLTPAGDLNRLRDLFGADNASLRAAAVRAAGAWKLEAARQQIAAFTGEAQTDALRHAAIDALAALGGKASNDALTTIADGAKAPADRVRAVIALADLDLPASAARAAKILADDKLEADPTQLLAPLLARKEGPGALASAFEKTKLRPDVAKLAIRVARASSSDTAALQIALRAAGGLTDTPAKPTPELIAAIVAEAKSKGDPHRGEAIFRRAEMQCLKCHAIGGAGGVVGPDMLSIGASAPIDYLVESLLDPGAKVKENYHSVIVETDEGRIFSGIPVQRTEKQLVLRDQNDVEVTLTKESIEAEREGRSLMPDGLVEPLTRAELADLTRFLSELGKDGPFAIGKDRVVRRWRKLTWSAEAHRLLNRTSHDSAATDNPVLVWEPAYSQVSGELPMEDLAPFKPHADLDPVSFARCEITVSTAGKLALGFNDPAGVTLWLDGKPVPMQKEITLDLAVGQHTLTLAINRKTRSSGLRLELANVEASSAQAQIVGGK